MKRRTLVSRLALGVSCLLVAACGASAQSEFDHEFDDSSGGTTPTDEVEQAIEQQRGVIQRLRNDPAARELVVKTFWTIAELHSRLRDQVAYRRALQDVVRSFEASGLSAGSDAADYAARAQFLLADDPSTESWTLDPGQQPTLEAYVRAVVEHVNRLTQRATAVAERLGRVASYGRIRWTLAAMVRRGQVYEEVVRAVLGTRFVMPADLQRHLVELDEAAQREIERAVEDRIRLELEEQAAPIECLAIAEYVAVARSARASGADTRDVRTAFSRLQRFDDARLSGCVERRRTHDPAFAAYTPGEFMAGPDGQLWVAVHTSEASVRVFATDSGETHCGFASRGAVGRLVRIASDRALVEFVDGGLTAQVWITRTDLRRSGARDSNPTRTRAVDLATYQDPTLGPPFRLPASAHLEHSGAVVGRIHSQENTIRAVAETAMGSHVIASGPQGVLSLFGLARGYSSLSVGHYARVVGEPPVGLRASSGSEARVGVIAPGAHVEVLRLNGAWVQVAPLGRLRLNAWMPVENLLGVVGTPEPAPSAVPAALLVNPDSTLMVLRAGSTISLPGGATATASDVVFATRASVAGGPLAAEVWVAANNDLTLRGSVRADALITPSSSASREPTPTLSRESSPDGSAPSAVLAALSAVVRIWCPIEPEGVASGSGTIVSTRGAVLTNFHVVGSPEHGTPYHSNRMCFVGPFRNARAAVQPEWVARVEFGLAGSDLAVLRVTAALRGFSLPAEFPAAAIGPDVNIGARVFVAGFPGSSTIELTSGAVSGFTSDRGGEWIRTDARINPGNSGGAMFDSQGRLVGVPTAVRALHVFEAVGHARPVGGVPREWWRL